MLLGNRIVHHLSYVVDDIEKAVQHWSSALGAGVTLTFSATRNFQPVFASTSSTVTPECTDARNASPSGPNLNTARVVIIAEGPERAGNPSDCREFCPSMFPAPKPGEVM